MWNTLYLSSDQRSDPRVPVSVVQQLAAIDFDQDGLGTASTTLKRTLYHLCDRGAAANVSAVEEDRKWGRVLKCLLSSGLYPLLESLDNDMKRHVFAVLNADARQRFQRHHAELMRFHSYKAQLRRG